MLAAASLVVLLLAFAVSAALRVNRSMQHLDIAALAAALSAAAWVVRGYWRARALARAARKPSPRWYELRPNIVGVGASLLLLVWWGARVPASMGQGPAGPDVPAEPFDRPWFDKRVVLISLGDSVSTGYGAGEGLGYFELIQRNRDGIYPEMRGRELRRVAPELSVIRLAQNSTNSMDHERVVQSLPYFKQDTFGLVCMTTGGIDLIHSYGKRAPREGAMYGADYATAKPWIERFEARLDRMMGALSERFPGGCAVFLATIYDPTDGESDIENAGPIFWLPAWEEGRPVFDGFNDAIRRVAERHDHVHLVDVHAVMLGHGIHCRDRDNPHYCPEDPTYWYYVNLEDPNQRGYDAIRRVFLNAMIQALASK